MSLFGGLRRVLAVTPAPAPLRYVSSPPAAAAAAPRDPGPARRREAVRAWHLLGREGQAAFAQWLAERQPAPGEAAADAIPLPEPRP